MQSAQFDRGQNFGIQNFLNAKGTFSNLLDKMDYSVKLEGCPLTIHQARMTLTFDLPE